MMSESFKADFLGDEARSMLLGCAARLEQEPDIWLRHIQGRKAGGIQARGCCDSLWDLLALKYAEPFATRAPSETLILLALQRMANVLGFAKRKTLDEWHDNPERKVEDIVDVMQKAAVFDDVA